MPYIPIVQRIPIEIRLREAAEHWITRPGELNFAITYLVNCYLRKRAAGGKPSYDEYNAVIGVLACAGQELYRRVIAAYEDEKREENSDVY